MNAAQKILLTVNILILLAAAVVLTVILRLKFLYATDTAAEQWELDTGTRYSQISAYVPQTEAFSIPDAHGKRYLIETKLKNDNTIEKNSEGQWTDCASAQTRCTVVYNKQNLETDATGTWGDFFAFHPEELVSGSYYSGNDINLFRAVIDDLTAWALYGTVDASEMTFHIGNIEFEVAGVVRSPLRTDDQTAYGSLPHIYLPIEAMSYISDVGLTSYEACMPYKVDGYAADVVKEYFSDSAEIVDQTGRFDLIKLVRGFKELPKSVMIQKGILYPWYENSVRAAEMKARVLAFPTALLLLIPSVSLVYLLFVIAKGIGRLFRFIAGKIDDKKQKRLKKAYERKKALEKAS